MYPDVRFESQKYIHKDMLIHYPKVDKFSASGSGPHCTHLPISDEQGSKRDRVNGP